MCSIFIIGKVEDENNVMIMKLQKKKIRKLNKKKFNMCYTMNMR